MSNGTMIVKRNGAKEPLNIEKIHFVVDEACKNLAGVSSSQIEMNANLQFYNENKSSNPSCKKPLIENQNRNS